MWVLWLQKCEKSEFGTETNSKLSVYIKLDQFYYIYLLVILRTWHAVVIFVMFNLTVD